MRFRHCLGRLRAREDGAATIEFVIVVPVFLILFMSSFELGMLLTRQVMLDRALDLAVREVRLGLVDFGDLDGAAQHDALRDMVCENALMENCQAELMLEMLPRDPRDWQAMQSDADCADRSAPGAGPRGFAAGLQNELVVLRACALFDPYFPTTGLGAQLDRQSGDAYALVSSSAYVVEPTE